MRTLVFALLTFFLLSVSPALAQGIPTMEDYLKGEGNEERAAQKSTQRMLEGYKVREQQREQQNREAARDAEWQNLQNDVRELRELQERQQQPRWPR